MKVNDAFEHVQGIFPPPPPSWNPASCILQWSIKCSQETIQAKLAIAGYLLPICLSNWCLAVWCLCTVHGPSSHHGQSSWIDHTRYELCIIPFDLALLWVTAPSLLRFRTPDPQANHYGRGKLSTSYFRIEATFLSCSPVSFVPKERFPSGPASSPDKPCQNTRTAPPWNDSSSHHRCLRKSEKNQRFS